MLSVPVMPVKIILLDFQYRNNTSNSANEDFVVLRVRLAHSWEAAFLIIFTSPLLSGGGRWEVDIRRSQLGDQMARDTLTWLIEFVIQWVFIEFVTQWVRETLIRDILKSELADQGIWWNYYRFVDMYHWRVTFSTSHVVDMSHWYVTFSCGHDSFMCDIL